jgi:zinc protease
VRVERLSNGLRLILKENRNKNIIALCGYINGGSRTEDDSIKGLSHYYEHIIFRGGTARQAELETRRAFQSLGDYGGYTSDDATCYYFTVPKENLTEAIRRYSDALMNFELTAEKIEKDRQSIIQEFHMSVSDKPWGLAYHNLRRAAYGGHTYKVDPLGFESVICSAQLDTFKTFYEERYVPNQITLAIVGNFESESMIDTIERAFGSYARGRDSFEPANPAMEKHDFREVGSHLETELSYFYLGFHLPPARSGDMAALTVLSRLLGSSRNARLDTALKHNEPIAHGVLGFLEIRKEGSMFTIAVDLKPEKQRRALEIIALELTRVINQPVDDDELERTKRLIENNHYSHYESFQNQAQGLCWYSVLSDVYDMERWLSRIRAVSSEDIQRVAAKYLRSENASLSTVAPEGETIESFKDLLFEKLSPPLRQEKREKDAAKIVDFELPCGARVLFQPEPGSGRFAAIALLGGGLLIEREAEAGINNFVAQLSLRGIEGASDRDIAREMAELGMETQASSTPDYSEFSLSCAASVWRSSLKIFFEILNRPSFPEKEIEKLKNEVITDIGSIGDDNFTLTGHEFNRVIYGSHPYSRSVFGTPDSVRNLSREKLWAFHERVYCGNNLLLAIAGEVEPSLLEQELRSLTAGFRRSVDQNLFAAELEIAGDNSLLVKSNPGKFHLLEKDSQQVTFNWGRLTVAAADRDSLALQLATNIIAYRLFYKHVYEEGMAYRMWTLLPMRRARAPFFFQMGVAPENFQRARDGIAREVEKFLLEPVPQDEFERAKATLLQKYFLAQMTCASLTGLMAHYTFYGYEDPAQKSYPERIKAIQKEEVESAAKKHIRMEEMMLVAVGKY